jgi:hypothetical protein
VLGPEPVDRLLEGIAQALRDEVLPHVGDDFARMQVKAAVELLGNLADRIEWDAADLAREDERWGALVETLRHAGWPGPAPAPADRRELLEQVADGVRWLEEHPDAGPEARAGVNRELHAITSDEIARLRRAMFR